MRKLSCLIGALPALVACPAHELAPPDNPVASALPLQPSALPGPPASQGPPVTLRGTIRYTPIPPTKSIESFLGQDLALIDGGSTWDLCGSKAVSEELLVGLAGKRVEITAEHIPARAPNPMEQAPMVGPRELMERPETWRVLSVQEIPE